MAVLALSALLGSWMGCASGGATNQTTTSGSGGGGSANSGPHTTSSTTGSTGGTGGTGGMMPGCKPDEKTCAGMCVKIDDPSYGCGTASCGACAPQANATATCSQGVCVLGACATGFKNCDGNDGNGCETDVQSDPMQCGACGSPCMVPNAVPSCISGVCGILSCMAGRTDCDMNPINGCEADLQNDPKNCNVCNVPCPVNETCQMGQCGVHCPKGKADCNNDNTDGCETPLYTNTDCNFCGDTCALPNSQSNCDMMGVCNLGPCDPGWQNCDAQFANGCEVNITTDASNCGSCGNSCLSGPHSTPVCNNSGCGLNCDPGYWDCDMNPTTGCEVHVDTDVNNCGVKGAGCGHQCVTPNATPTCAGGLCLVQSCNAGFQDCDMAPTNGCEINIKNDPNNCGGCGVHCMIANGTASCVNGMCAVGTCATGFADCDGQVSNGCETPVGGDVNNCGTCGHVCSITNGTAKCTGGTCAVAACNPGFTDCNNQPGDGCETSTSTDPNNCGGCNHQCFVANGTAGCAAGNCTVAACNMGYGDCNNLAGDGCEIHTAVDATNCGTCGNNCATTCAGSVLATTCGGGACSIVACAAGHFNLDGTCSNGCECASSGTSAICATPSSLGALQVGQGTTYTGNLVPAGQEAYLSITFNGNTNPAYHPHITMSPASAGEFAFDVSTNCTGTLIACGVEGGASSGRSDWEEVYTAGDSTSPNFNAIPPVGIGGAVIIHVYRKSGMAVSCNNYQLTIGN
jgi:hypothetical protein